MRMQRRCYTFLILFALCVFGVLQLYLLRSAKSRKAVVIIDPDSKKHWFRLKISKHTEKQASNHKGKVTKTILLWTNFFGKANYIPPLEDLHCPISDCLITSNRSYHLQSDAIIFHLRDINLGDMPTLKQSQQRWILLHHESPPHTPDILKFLSGHFNWTATYRLDSDILLTPLVKKRKHIVTFSPDHSKSKTRMVAWFASNCYTNSNREGFVKELQKSIPVDIFGDCGPKKCLPKMSKECYRKVSAEYRYFLSFENSICKDYVTEKFFDILQTSMIPVVMGGANYSEVGPPSSFIDALSFHSPRELAHFLLAIAKDAKKYNSFFHWKKMYEISYEHYACQICRKLHEDNIPTVHDDLHEWWFGDAKCKTWSPVHQAL